MFFNFLKTKYKQHQEFILISVTALILLLFLQFSRISSLLGDAIFDNIERRNPIPASQDILVVTIDEDSINRLGGWPISREYYALLFDRIKYSEIKPRAIGLDILFLDSQSNDLKVSRSIQGLPIVLPIQINHLSKDHISIKYPVVANKSTKFAHIDLVLDNDGKVREVMPEHKTYPHFAYAIAEMAAPIKQPKMATRFARIDDSAKFPTISLADLLDNEHAIRLLQGKYVLIGATAASLGDLYPVHGSNGSTGFMPGIYIHANVLNSLIQNRNISIVGPWLNFIFSLPLLFFFIIGLFELSVERRKIVTTIAVLILTLILCGLFFRFGRVWINPAGLILTIFIIMPAWSWLRMRKLLLKLQSKINETQKFLPRAEHYMENISDALTTINQAEKDELAIGIDLLSNQTFFLQSIIDQLPDHVFIFDINQELWLSNSKAKDILTHFPGKNTSNFQQLISALNGQCDEEGKLLLNSLKSQSMLKINGEVKHYKIVVKLVNKQNQHTWVIMCLTDITNIIFSQQQRERSMQLLSHDMRTPVITILTICRQAFHQGFLSKTDYTHVTDNTDLLLTYMDDFILTIKAEREHYQTHEILLAELLTEAVVKVQPLLTSAGMTIDEIEDEYMQFVNVDSRLMLRVFINLLFNAINHGEERSHISIQITKDNNGYALVRIGNRKSIKENKNTYYSGYGLGNDFIDNVIRRHKGEVIRHFPEEPGSYVWVEVRFKCC